MTAIEERLARDIAAVTGGVVVTESDLRDAREAVDERLSVQQQRSRRRTLAATAVAAVVIPILGFAAFQQWGGDSRDAAPVNPAPSVSADPGNAFLTGETPTPELLDGVWRVDNGTMLMRFAAPDRVWFDDAGRLFGDPAVTGTYVLQGDRIDVEVDDGPATCAGVSFAIRAVIAEPGIAHVQQTGSGAGDCLDLPGTLWTLEHVLPTSKGLSVLSSSGEQGWGPLTDRVLDGAWLAEGGGHVLELDAGGSYYVADESGAPVDRGGWSLRRSELTLMSSAASEACNTGDRLVWSDLEQLDSGTTGIRGTVRENTCGAGWTPKTWMLLPDAR